MQEPFLQDDPIAHSPQVTSPIWKNGSYDESPSHFSSPRQDKVHPPGTNAELERRRDRLLEVTAAVAQILLTAENLDHSIQQALQLLGETLESDRVNVIENFVPTLDCQFPHWRVLYEWNSPKTPSQFSDLNASQGSYEEIPEIFERLRQGQTVTYRIEDSPEPFRSKQIAIGVKVTYLVPIQVEGQWWGIVGLDDCWQVKHRNPTELTVLGILANCVASAIQRQRSQQALLQAEQERAAELARSNEALQQTIDTLGSLDNFDDFIPTVLTIVARTFNANNCAYYEHNLDETVYLRYWFSNGKILNPLELKLLDSEQHRVLRQLADGFTVPLEHLHGTTVRDRTRSVIIDHTCAKASPAFHTFAVSQGWGLELNQPLLVDGKADGALVIYRELNQPFSDSEIMLVEGLAKQLALAMQASRLSAQARDRAVETAIAREREKAAQQQAAELSRANTLLRNSLSRLSTEPNLNDVLGQLLLEVTRYAGASVGHVFSYDATHATLTMKLRVRDEQVFWTPADDEPAIFRSPIPVATTPVFTHLCEHPQLATLNIHEFSGRLWTGVPEWFQAKGIRGTSSCVLLVGDRPFGFLAMAFPHPVALRLVDEELILALAQQIALVMQLTTLAEAAKETALLEERNRFARDIHDTIAQALTGIILQLEATKSIIATQPEVAHEHLFRARALARDGLAEARRSVWALRPEALESNDLPTVLHHLAQRMTTGTQLNAVVEVTGTPFPLSPTLEMNLLRIGQEALTNVLRHAEATVIRLTLHFTSQAVQLEVVDDGQGFDSQKPTVDRGFGLIGMQERSQRLGGRFSLVSQPGSGTTVLVTVPTSGGQVP
jgi:signal transduction histidine kinase